MKNLFFLVVGILVCVGMIQCANSQQQQSAHDSAMVSSQESEEIAKPNEWEYYKETDDLTGKAKAYVASLASENSQPIGNGNESRLILQVRYSHFLKKDVNSVVLIFENELGRFAYKNGTGFLVTFDGGDVDERWTYLGDMVSPGKRVLTITPDYMESDKSAKDFITMLKESKQCKIQVNIENGGMRTFEFNCANLEWDF